MRQVHFLLYRTLQARSSSTKHMHWRLLVEVGSGSSSRIVALLLRPA